MNAAADCCGALFFEKAGRQTEGDFITEESAAIGYITAIKIRRYSI